MAVLRAVALSAAAMAVVAYVVAETEETLPRAAPWTPRRSPPSADGGSSSPSREAALLDVADPYSRDEIAACLERAAREVGELFASLPSAAFAARPAPEAWSPGEHLAHLVLSTRAVERALALPRPVLWLRFGPARGRSRRYVEVRDAYRVTLAAGGRATAAFVPRPAHGVDAASVQRDTLARWHRTSRALVARLHGWDEAALDRVRLPHPLLGKMTVREILLFTLYHDLHHRDAVRRQLPAALPGE